MRYVCQKLRMVNLGKDPFKALMLIDRLGLYDTIFTDPANAIRTTPDLNCWQQTYRFLCSALCLTDQDTSSLTVSRSMIQSILIRDAEEAYLGWLLASLTPWAIHQAPPTGKPGRKKIQPMAAVVAREGLKVNNKILEVITGACTNWEEISKLVINWKYSPKEEDTRSGIIDRTDRSVLGMSIRRWGFNWRYHVLFALLLDLKRVGNNTQGSSISPQL
jgi:tRNA nucleotidyltransferase (CCA-adding enzyme)